MDAEAGVLEDESAAVSQGNNEAFELIAGDRGGTTDATDRQQEGGFSDRFALTSEDAKTFCLLSRNETNGAAGIQKPGRPRALADRTGGERWSKLGNSSCRLGQGLFRDGDCVATGEAVMVLVDLASNRPTPIPEVLRDAILALSHG